MTDKINQKFFQHIVDMIKEQEIKIGYRKENVRLYYPGESLKNLLGLNENDTELQIALEKFVTDSEQYLGRLEITNSNDRYCVKIPMEGVEYVHNLPGEYDFLMEFIPKIGSGHCTIEELLAIFHKYSNAVCFKPVTHGEFDYVIYFMDGHPDQYRYCIHIDHDHAIYHRFLEEDYNSFGFEDE